MAKYKKKKKKEYLHSRMKRDAKCKDMFDVVDVVVTHFRMVAR